MTEEQANKFAHEIGNLAAEYGFCAAVVMGFEPTSLYVARGIVDGCPEKIVGVAEDILIALRTLAPEIAARLGTGIKGEMHSKHFDAPDDEIKDQHQAAKDAEDDPELYNDLFKRDDY